MIISSTEYAEILQPIAKSVHTPRDAQLFCPSVEWLKPFGEFLLEKHRQGKREKYDCDDFTLDAVVEATNAFNQNQQINDSGHSFGYVELWIGLDGLNGVPGPGFHATNIVLCSNRTIYLFEPQTGLFCPFDDGLDCVLSWVWM